MCAETISAVFAPVLVGPEREASPVAAAPASADASAVMLIELGDATLTIAADAPPALVERALRALRR